jgi:hypothetical protein
MTLLRFLLRLRYEGQVATQGRPYFAEVVTQGRPYFAEVVTQGRPYFAFQLPGYVEELRRGKRRGRHKKEIRDYD